MRGRDAPRMFGGSNLELDLDEHELEVIRIYHVVLDADLAGVGHAGAQRRGHRRLAVEDMQLPSGDGHYDVVVHVLVPAGVAARRKAPFGDDDAVVLDLNG